MKRILSLLMLAAGLSNSLYAQNIDLEKSELQSLLCKRWRVEFAMMGTMKITQKPGAKNPDFLFKKDEAYDILDENGKLHHGKWKYYRDKKYVELSIQDRVISRITSIGKTKLILTMVSDGKNDPPGLPTIEVHYKPI